MTDLEQSLLALSESYRNQPIGKIAAQALEEILRLKAELEKLKGPTP